MRSLFSCRGYSVTLLNLYSAYNLTVFTDNIVSSGLGSDFS